MKNMIAVLLVGVFCVGCSLRAAENNESTKPATGDKKEGGKVHASLAAYPGAIIKAEDKDSQITVEVKENGTDLVAKKNDKDLWIVVLAKGNEVGTPVIRHVAIAEGKVSVVIGKHRFVTVDLNTGKMLSDASD
jgi:hypothetical protein